MKLRILLFTCLLVLIISCEEDALDDYYNQKGNFSGSIYDALDSTGLYSYFLHGVDSSDLANQLKHTLVTVIAPSDKAFEAFFSEKGYDMSSIPTSELQDIIGHHILTWPHSPSSLQTEPDDYKRQTNMARRSVIKFDQNEGQEESVVQDPKYLQFYFPEMLSYYGATTDDYRLISGTEISASTGINVYDVQVDSIIPYGNGWIYYVDKVIEPLENIDNWLLRSEEYSLFNKLYNRYSYYTGGALNLKRSNLFQNDRGYRIDMDLNHELLNTGFTMIAPKNTAIESFISDNFSGYPGFEEALDTLDKSSLESLHIHSIVRTMLFPYMFIDNQVYPSRFLSEEGINGNDGTNFKFTEGDIAELTLCSNGLVYGIDDYIVPRSFSSILKPTTTSPDYKYFLAAVFKAQIFGFLNDFKANHTLMLPSDSAFIKNNIRLMPLDEFINDWGGNSDDFNEFRDEVVFVNVDTSGGNEAEGLNVQDIFDLVFAHLFTESITPSAQKQFALNAVGDYVGITQDSVWSGGNMESRWTTGSSVMVDLIETITGTDNGAVYVVNDLIESPKLSLGQMLNTNPAYSRFRDICKNSELLSDEGVLNVVGNYPTVFVPTNEALDAFITDNPLPTDPDEYKAFVKYFFLDKAAFTSESIDASVVTLCKDEELSDEFTNVYKTVDLKGSPGSLTIKGKNNADFMEVLEGGESNTICTNGIIHLVNGVLN